MTDLLFDTPWWLPAGIAAAGVVLFISGNKRQETRVRLAGVVAVALAALLMGVSYLVDTDAERAVKHSKALVDAFERQDWNKMESLLDPKVSLAYKTVTFYNDRDAIMRAAREAAARYNFKSVDVISSEVLQVQTIITVTLKVVSVQDETMGRPMPTTWQFDWQETGNGWIIFEIRCMEGPFGDQIQQYFPRLTR